MQQTKYVKLNLNKSMRVPMLVCWCFFTKKAKSKERHNSCKNEFKITSLVCTYSPFYSKHIF